MFYPTKTVPVWKAGDLCAHIDPDSEIHPSETLQGQIIIEPLLHPLQKAGDCIRF